jgi:hypothetical protein
MSFGDQTDYTTSRQTISRNTCSGAGVRSWGRREPRSDSFKRNCLAALQLAHFARTFTSKYGVQVGWDRPSALSLIAHAGIAPRKNPRSNPSHLLPCPGDGGFIPSTQRHLFLFLFIIIIIFIIIINLLFFCLICYFYYLILPKLLHVSVVRPSSGLIPST